MIRCRPAQIQNQGAEYVERKSLCSIGRSRHLRLLSDRAPPNAATASALEYRIWPAR